MYCIKGEKGGPHNGRGHWEWGKDIIFQHTLNEANTKRLTPNPKHKSALLTVYTHQALPHLSVLMTLSTVPSRGASRKSQQKLNTNQILNNFTIFHITTKIVLKSYAPG